MFSILVSGFLACVANAATLNLSVASSGGNASSPLAYGLMFEDINHSGDGGLYAELIQNRAFQGGTVHPTVIKPWAASGDATLTLQNLPNPLSSALPTSVEVSGTGVVGLVNPGWWGIEVKPQTYTGSFWVLGEYDGNFTVSLRSNATSEVFASTTIESTSSSESWTEHKFTLAPQTAAADEKNVFVLEYEAATEPLNFNLISLFPPTYKNRANGNRVELMEALKALNPTFLRLPGGNNLEGESASHQQWKWNETIGPLTQRPGRPGTWGYQNTDGLGLIEYLQWCDDLEIEPILAVWAGLYLNGYVSPPDIIPEDQLGPYVQDTLDELEFITGSVDTPYGALRASLGYPEPWVIKYVEVGNEDHLGNASYSYSQYRFRAYNDAIKAKYPDITVISSTGDFTALAEGSATDFHQYARPDLKASQFGLWDHVATPDHLTLIGEYAVIQQNSATQQSVDWSAAKLRFPTWIGAVGETIFSFSAERNSPGILGSSYAPLLQNLNGYQWTPDLISYTADTSATILSASYHAIKLLSTHLYDATVPVTAAEGTNFGPAYWVAGVSEPGKYTFKAAVYNATEAQDFNVAFAGLSAGATGELTVLSAADGWSANVPGGEEVVQRNVTTLTAAEGGVFSFELEALSIAVLTT
ncbi:glycoside hydrolase superfamily [Bisporella sp. PMI_857]|nr:glycoside hydrolase superfamily [Bisporella sp. PMI_857]